MRRVERAGERPGREGRLMIYGALCDIGRYRGLYRGLDALIDWLAEHDPAQLDCGSHEILG